MKQGESNEDSVLIPQHKGEEWSLRMVFFLNHFELNPSQQVEGASVGNAVERNERILEVPFSQSTARWRAPARGPSWDCMGRLWLVEGDQAPWRHWSSLRVLYLLAGRLISVSSRPRSSLIAGPVVGACRPWLIGAQRLVRTRRRNAVWRCHERGRRLWRRFSRITFLVDHRYVRLPHSSIVSLHVSGWASRFLGFNRFWWIPLALVWVSLGFLCGSSMDHRCMCELSSLLISLG